MLPGTTYATGSMDVGVAPERRLTFRLAQPLAALTHVQCGADTPVRRL